jgi:molybdopterin molybdotransferase
LDGHEHPALSLDDARRAIDAAIEPVAAIERVALKDGLDRVLAVDLTARVAVPAHDNAAMDGYALRGGSGPRRLHVVGTARAGAPFHGTVGSDECVRIFTGAVMPVDCDAVIAQEQVAVDGDFVVFDAPTPPGLNRRLAGEDLAVGAIVVARGRRLAPSDLGLAASVGEKGFTVFRRPRVAVFSTGDELRDIGAALDPGSIRDSNRYTLIAMLSRLGVEVVDLGIIADDPAALEAVLRKTCRTVNAIVTSGGVSAGGADHTRAVMDRLGGVTFWKLAIKPGRPMAFGRITDDGRSALLFGLPGNPVAVMVVFYALVREALLKLMGARVEPMPSITATCDVGIVKSPGRTEFVRGVATRDDDGWHVRPTGAQGSGILRSMSEANCLIVLAHGRGPVTPGEAVEAWPFQGLV